MAEDIQVKREIVVEADAETLERARKEGQRGASRYIAMRENAPAGKIQRRRRWPTSGFRSLSDFSPRFPGTGK